MIETLRNWFKGDALPEVILFHHLPKCGGTSVRAALKEWFPVVPIYRSGRSDTPPEAPRLRSLERHSVLAGHFELPGNHWRDLYPEAEFRSEIRVMTFLREPLELQASLYRFEVKRGFCGVANLSESLKLRPNYMASLLHATEENRTEILDRYWFVGLAERTQDAFDMLAHALGKPRLVVPRRNTTEVRPENDVDKLSDDEIQAFREANALDYWLYEEGSRRFARFKEIHATSTNS